MLNQEAAPMTFTSMHFLSVSSEVTYHYLAGIQSGIWCHHSQARLIKDAQKILTKCFSHLESRIMLGIWFNLEYRNN